MFPSLLRVVPGSVLAVLACVLAFVANGDAITCFVCDSSDNPSCADLKSNSSIVPEECSVTKMKSIKTWLFELNEISYFDTGVVKDPLMNCQKVVAKNPNTQKMVTARFCQLDTGESDACSILRNKLRSQAELHERDHSGGNNRNNNNNKNNKDRKGEEEEEQFHCSICSTDRCNGSERLMALTGSGFLATLAAIMQQRALW